MSAASLVRLCFAAVVLSQAVGCQPVQEDRTVQFSDDGKSVGFQHGKEGVFVADDQGGELKKIYEPTDDVLAVGTPQFAPHDKRLIFASAKAVRGDSGVSAFDLLNPAGATHVAKPCVFTCLLRGVEPDAVPVELFTAECDHVGYVAANLAVRWSPDGKRIVYLDRAGRQKHGVFEFDLTTQSKRQVFPHGAEAVVFDYAPDGVHLVVVLGGEGTSDRDGIWIGAPGDDASWWHVPESASLASGKLPSIIEQLRATRPAWTTDGKRFAFVSYKAPADPNGAGRHLLREAEIASRSVRTLATADVPFRDLHWSPDGLRLGVVRGQADAGSLHIVADGKLGPAINKHPVRTFAGWHSDGSHLAYVSPDPSLPAFDGEARDNHWACLFLPDPLARDSVFLAAGDCLDGGREVISGVRVTFPNWSPTEAKLSLWATFSPVERSWAAQALGAALSPGDPAAVVDLPGGEFHWMAVNAHEKAQVGHYYLQKHDDAEAWRWYEAARQAATEKSPAPADLEFFEYICLTRLGRKAEADKKLESFHRTFIAPVDRGRLPIATIAPNRETAEKWLSQLTATDGFLGMLLRDLYQAEVFRAVESKTEAEAFFRERLAAATSDEARLSRAIVLAQMLLLRGDDAGYVELAGSTLLPLVGRLGKPDSLNSAAAVLSPEGLQQLSMLAAGALTAMPLADAKVLAGAKLEHVQLCVDQLEAIRGKFADEASQNICAVLLYATARNANLEDKRSAAAADLKTIYKEFEESKFDEEVAKVHREFLKTALALVGRE